MGRIPIKTEQSSSMTLARRDDLALKAVAFLQLRLYEIVSLPAITLEAEERFHLVPLAHFEISSG